jgi:hypothetical protein
MTMFNVKYLRLDDICKNETCLALRNAIAADNSSFRFLILRGKN